MWKSITPLKGVELFMEMNPWKLVWGIVLLIPLFLVGSCYVRMRSDSLHARKWLDARESLRRIDECLHDYVEVHGKLPNRLESQTRALEDGRVLKACNGHLERAAQGISAVLAHTEASASLMDEVEQQVKVLGSLPADPAGRETQEKLVRSLIDRLDERLSRRKDLLEDTLKF